MSDVPTNPRTVRALCQGCGHQGDVSILPPGGKVDIRAVAIRPGWCTCKPPKRGGPYVAPPGYIAKFTLGASTR